MRKRDKRTLSFSIQAYKEHTEKIHRFSEGGCRDRVKEALQKKKKTTPIYKSTVVSRLALRLFP